MIDAQDLKENSSAAGEADIYNSDDPIPSTLPVQNPKFARLVKVFCQKLEEKLPELETAIANLDYEKVTEIAHWLKGSGGNVGYKCFRKPAGELEELAIANSAESLTEQFDKIKSLQVRLLIPDVDSDEGDLSNVRKSA